MTDKPERGPVRPWPQPVTQQPPRRPGTALIMRRWAEAAIPVVMVIAGIIVQQASGAKLAVCNSSLGQIGQAFSGSANAECASEADLHAFGGWLLWLGLAGAVAAAVRLWQAYQAAQVLASPGPDTEPWPAPDKDEQAG